MIVVTVFFPILNQQEFHLVQNQKENCLHDHIPFNLKGNIYINMKQWLFTEKKQRLKRKNGGNISLVPVVMQSGTVHLFV